MAQAATMYPPGLINSEEALALGLLDCLEKLIDQEGKIESEAESGVLAAGASTLLGIYFSIYISSSTYGHFSCEAAFRLVILSSAWLLFGSGTALFLAKNKIERLKSGPMMRLERKHKLWLLQHSQFEHNIEEKIEQESINSKGLIATHLATMRELDGLDFGLNKVSWMLLAIGFAAVVFIVGIPLATYSHICPPGP